jgi:hypothetical protein
VQVGGGVIVALQGAGAGVDRDGGRGRTPDRAIQTWLPPIPGVQEPAEGSLFTHLFTHGPQLHGRGQTEQHYLDASPTRVSAGQNRFGWSAGIFMNGHLSDF